MEIYQAIVLGVAQGLTEFLPVSSSGHLVLGQYLFGLVDVPLYFDVSLHIGTLAAVFIIFFRDIRGMVAVFCRFCQGRFGKKSIDLSGDPNGKLLLMIIAGSVPTAFIGLMLSKVAETLFSSLMIVGIMLLITGTFLWLSRKAKPDTDKSHGLTVKNALIIGVIQGFAVVPGISRSGSTIVAGLFLGLSRETAARFSFLLSIPAILGAAVLSFKDVADPSLMISPPVIWGTIASFITGYFALILLVRIVKQGHLYYFAPYCWCMGIWAIITAL